MKRNCCTGGSVSRSILHGRHVVPPLKTAVFPLIFGKRGAKIAVDFASKNAHTNAASSLQLHQAQSIRWGWD